MTRTILRGILAAALAIPILLVGAGCSTESQAPSPDKAQNGDPVKIGVSFGVGDASRWVSEQQYMENRAAELDVEIEVRLNKTDEPKTQTEDCIEMIDGGIDVLILTPRDVNNVQDILAYAKQHNVPVVDYARAITNEDVDLFVGYDSDRIGQTLGQYLTELVDEGDYIILSGDPGDYNAELLNEGALRYIDPIRSDINVILETSVPGWSPDAAKQLVYDAVSANGNSVDAILAPNDKIAGACREALDELGITDPVIITGMDAELDAAKRVVDGKQSVTVYMDLEELATTAVDEACHLARGEAVNANADFDNGTENGITANLITGKLVTKENLDKILIDSGYFTREDVYGE